MPNLLIAGVSHSGTTSLFTYLSSHPEICASKIKETHYFYPIMIGKGLDTIQEYQKYFRHCENQRYIMEAGPGYLYGGKKLSSLIKKMLGELKLIFILRDPVTKLHAYFRYKNKSLQIEDLSFNEFIHLAIEQFHDSDLSQEALTNNPTNLAIDGGLYAKYLQEWYEDFEEGSIKVVFFDDLKNRPLYLLETICQWLDIDPHMHSCSDFTTENRGFFYKSRSIHKLAIALNDRFEPFFRTYPSVKRTLRELYMLNAKNNPSVLDDNTKTFLTNFYAPYNAELYSLLQSKGYHDNLPDWLASSSVVLQHSNTIHE